MTILHQRSTIAAPAGVRRLFASATPDLRTHEATYGPTPRVDGEALVRELAAAGLTGRGGAGFPVWRKLRAGIDASTTSRRPAIVIANGAEGEPLSSKDATLLASSPHLVIDGLLLVASAVSASDLVVYAGSAALAPVRRAIGERSDAAGISLHAAVDTFISGEASAVVRAVEGGPSLPRDHVVRLTSAGVDRRPTLVHNVESLAQLALIARFGGDWFRSAGTETEPGTRLLSISVAGRGRAATGGAIAVREVGGGSSIAGALAAASIDPSSLSAVLVGGYHGAWVPSSAFGMALDAGALAPFAANPGAGILLGLPKAQCGLGVASRVTDYLAQQSAAPCGPCINGLPRMADTFRQLATRGRDAALPLELRRLSDLVAGRGSCHHPDGTARLVLSTLATFADDVDAHLEGRCLHSVATRRSAA